MNQSDLDEIYKIDENYYYVYEHSIDDEVFYVGKGKGGRAFDFEGRNKGWLEKVGKRTKDVKVEIKGYFKGEQDAFEYEKILIDKYLFSGVKLENVSFNFDNSAYKKRTAEFEKYKDINYSPISECRYSHYFEVLMKIEREIKLGNKVLIFYDSTKPFKKNDSLISKLLEIDELNIFLFSPFKKNDDINNYKRVKKGFFPKESNVLIYPLNILSVDYTHFVDEDINLIVIDTLNYKKKDKALSRCKFKRQNVLYKSKFSDGLRIEEIIEIKGINFDKYLNTNLTAKQKQYLCDELYILDAQGRIKRWPSVRGFLEKDGYQIEDKYAYPSGKKTRVTIITKNKSESNEE